MNNPRPESVAAQQAAAQPRVRETQAAGTESAAARRRGIGRLTRDVRHTMISRVASWVPYDTAAAIASAVLGYRLSPNFPDEFTAAAITDAFFIVPVFGAVFVLAALVAGLYERRCLRTPFASVMPTGVAVALAWGVVILGYYFITYRPIGRWVVAISGVIVASAAVLPRVVLGWFSARSPQRVLVVGDERAAGAIDAAKASHSQPNVEIVAVFPGESSHASGRDQEEMSVLPGRCSALDADVVVVDSAGSPDLLDYAAGCIRAGTQVIDLVSFIENTFQKVPVEIIGMQWLVSADLKLTRPLSAAVKRTTDIALAFLGMILTLPFWPLVALLIKLSSRGPVFYSQLRVGRFDRPFVIYKFRTMRTDAETNGKAKWASHKDPRVTWLGRLLRKTRFDEVPQFMNILKGDMSFVGPRPERPEFVDAFADRIPRYRLRHLVRPGVTGWAQVMFRYGAGEDDALEKLRYELYYIKHGGLAFDAKIVLRTIGALVKGAR